MLSVWNVVLVKFCEAIVVVPDKVAPVIPAGTLVVQVILAPGVEEVRFICDVALPEQMVCVGIENTTVGLGFTFMVYSAVFTHEFALAVTVKVTVPMLFSVLIRVCPGIFPLPLGVFPVTPVEATDVQEKVVP